jgi:hypothetical protein
MLSASVKFLFSAPVGYGFGFSLWTVFLGLTLGGWLGTFVFFYSARHFMDKAEAKRKERFRKAYENGTKPPRTFTRLNKFIVKVRSTIGYFGVVFILLPIISIPIEAILCAKFYGHHKTIIPVLLFSVTLWSLILSVAWKYVF